MSFLWYDQICVLVAVAILEKVAWHFQICNSCFYQVRESDESWPMGLLFIFIQCYIQTSRDNALKHKINPFVNGAKLEFRLHYFLCGSMFSGGESH